MLRALESNSVQIVSTAAGLALAAYFVTQWQARKKIDPSIDPLKGGADPNFPGGKPIKPHLNDPSPVYPSCEVYDANSNMFMNLGNPQLDESKDKCFQNVASDVVIRYTDKDQKIWLLRDQLYYPGDVPGQCYFPDENGNLYFPLQFAPPNQSSRLCFNSAVQQDMEAFFYIENNIFKWNPDMNFATSKLPGWTVRFANNVDPGTTDKDEVQILTDATMTSNSTTVSGQIFVRDPTGTSLSVEEIRGRTDRRLFLPSRKAIVYFNPRATDERMKFVAYPMWWL